ncbi:MAG: NAD(P)/FAD-dependent oxidoreductase, partial [Ferruginibacter sp.]
MYNVSIWERESFLAPQDVIIIGSGFNGLWSAYYLKKKFPQYAITVLERGAIPYGASTRNAGFSCFGSPSELLQDAETMGADNMWKLVEMRYKGLAEIGKQFSNNVTEFDGSGGYECFTEDSKDWDISIEKLDWLNAGMKNITGDDQTFTLADDKIVTFGFKGFAHLIENRFEGGVHSGRFAQHLLRTIQQMGVQVLTGINVERFEKSDKGVNVFSTEFQFTCKQLLLCTNAFTKDLIPEMDIIPNRGQVLVTEPIENLPFKGTFHFDQGYYYFRNLGNRLLLGGARNKAFDAENTTDINITTLIQEELERFMQVHLLPGISYTISDRWSGIMAMGSEKMPIVQQVDDH